MGLEKKVESIRTDPLLSEQEKVWKALKLIAKQLDEDDDLELLGAIFGDD